jgi:hypothetical protein
LSFIRQKEFLDILGLKKQTEAEIQEEREAVMHLQYFDPVKNFPEKIDQLLEALNRVCLAIIMHYLYVDCY